MTIRELIEMIENDYCNGDIQETIEVVNELIGDIHINPNEFISDFIQEKEKYARDENNRCEVCGLPLQEDFQGEEHEYMGSSCSETPDWHCVNPGCYNF
ncbi:hypothetical protein [uncultured Clostridium sp.]|uniref:hypothetical protein n=1 Tax=uncultured Clostridium sp. TaxID=59620 RepID=UPI00321652A6